MPSKIGTKVKRFLNGQIREILVPKSNNLPLRNQESQLVLTGITEPTQLNTSHFRSRCWRQML